MDVVVGDGIAIELVDGDDWASDDSGVGGVASFDRCAFLVEAGMVMLRLSDRESCGAKQRDSGELHCEEAYS